MPTRGASSMAAGSMSVTS